LAETLINKGFQPFFIYRKIELGAVLGAVLIVFLSINELVFLIIHYQINHAMKLCSFALLLCFFPLFVKSQTKSIHLVKYEATINPIFSKVSKKINFFLGKVSIIDSPKSVIFLKIDISDRKSELVGSGGSVGLGGGMFGNGYSGIAGGLLGSSFSSSKQFLYRNTTGTIILNKIQFDTLFSYFTKVNELIRSQSDEPKFYDISYNFGIENLEINLELAKKNYSENAYSNGAYNTYIDKQVYLKIDESIFGFKEDEFVKLFNEVITKIKTNWVQD
jgi:hypothetical protein